MEKESIEEKEQAKYAKKMVTNPSKRTFYYFAVFFSSRHFNLVKVPTWWQNITETHLANIIKI